MSAVRTAKGKRKPPPAVRRQAPGASGTLRERHAEQTRELIFNAIMDEVAYKGITEFNIPRLARRAGVSIRTVYRYFPTKDALLYAFGDWIDERTGPAEWPRDADALARSPETQFLAFDEREPIIRSQWVTPQGRAIRARTRIRRLAASREVLREVTANLEHEEAEDALAVVAYLLSSRTWLALKEDFNMDGHRSGRAVSWALRLLVDDLRRRNRQAAAAGKRRRPAVSAAATTNDSGISVEGED